MPVAAIPVPASTVGRSRRPTRHATVAPDLDVARSTPRNTAAGPVGQLVARSTRLSAGAGRTPLTSARSVTAAAPCSPASQAVTLRSAREPSSESGGVVSRARTASCTAWRITAAYTPSSHVMASDPRTLSGPGRRRPLMCTAHLCRRERPHRVPGSTPGATALPPLSDPRPAAGRTRDLCCPWGYRRATSGSGSSTFHPSGVLPSGVLPGSVLTGTAELAAPVTNSRVIDQLTQPADPSQTASQQALATGSAGGPETSGASPTFNPDPR